MNQEEFAEYVRGMVVAEVDEKLKEFIDSDRIFQAVLDAVDTISVREYASTMWEELVRAEFRRIVKEK